MTFQSGFEFVHSFGVMSKFMTPGNWASEQLVCWDHEGLVAQFADKVRLPTWDESKAVRKGARQLSWLVAQRLAMLDCMEVEWVAILFIELGHRPKTFCPQVFDLGASRLRQRRRHIFTSSWNSAEGVGDCVFVAFLMRKHWRKFFQEWSPSHDALSREGGQLVSEVFVVGTDRCSGAEQHGSECAERLHHT